MDAIAERFFAKVDVGLCWDWMGDQAPGGYGTFTVGARFYRAHRWAWEYLVGPIPDRLHLDHLCLRPPCVNPDHLEPVTRKVNAERGWRPKLTHCPYNHEYTPENTLIDNGTRRCRACRNAYYRRRYARTAGERGIPPGLRITCPRGHALVAENLDAYELGRGHRICKACNRERSAAYHAGRPFDDTRADALFIRYITPTERAVKIHITDSQLADTYQLELDPTNWWDESEPQLDQNQAHDLLSWWQDYPGRAFDIAEDGGRIVLATTDTDSGNVSLHWWSQGGSDTYWELNDFPVSSLQWEEVGS